MPFFGLRAPTAGLAVFLVLGLAPADVAAGPSISVDVATGKVLSQDNASQRWYPASTTKLMTAYLALRDIAAGRASLDTPVVVSRLAAAQAPGKMGYPAGSVMRLDKALRMMLVKSANDIAVAIGETLAGSNEAFVARMNTEAARLGMADTHFVNPNGLPGPGQYSSAKDLAMLGIAIRREFPAFTNYFSTEAIRAGDATMVNGNGLLGRFNGADGMKTGYICASGFNLVSSATRNGRTVLAVVLGAEGPISRERDSARLLEEAFRVDPAKVTLEIGQLPTSSGPPFDISDTICSDAARTARANERQLENNREQPFGSPYLTALDRDPVTYPVELGNAAGARGVAPGIAAIAGYGIPIPTWRPEPPAQTATGDAPATTPDRGGRVVETQAQ